MDDLTLPATLSIERTVAGLDRLHQAAAQRRTSLLTQWQSRMTELDAGVAPPVEPPPERDERPVSRRRGRASPADEVPFVPLPQRTTHGGPFGPVVRAKLIAEALEKRGRW